MLNDKSARRSAPSTILLLVILSAFWTALAHAQNAATQPTDASPATAVTRLACVGDSITFGAGIADRKKDSYPSQLAALLGDQWQVRNFGVSGATLLKKGDRPYNKQKAYQPALDYKPDVLVIMLGTNDSKPQNWSHKDDFDADYKDLISTFRAANPDVKIYVCLPVPAFPGGFGIREEIIAGEILPLVQQIAQDTHSTLIDLHAALSEHADLFPDKIHPNAHGATLMAAAVYQALTGHPAPTTAPSEHP